MLNKIIFMLCHLFLICTFKFNGFVCRICCLACRFALFGRVVVQVWFHWFSNKIVKIVSLGASLTSFFCRSIPTTSTSLFLFLLQNLNFLQIGYHLRILSHRSISLRKSYIGLVVRSFPKFISQFYFACKVIFEEI